MSSRSSGAQGFEFVDAIVGGAIPRQFIPAVEKGVQEAMVTGGYFGFPVVDVRVTCYDGKYHSVDSSEMSFKMAASIGFKEALAAAGPVLLEPVSRLEVTVPAAYQGDVLGDLNSRRGRVLGTEAGERGEQVVIALVPDVRDPALCDRPALAHRRPGAFRRPPRPPRGRAGADRRAPREAGRRRPDRAAVSAAPSDEARSSRRAATSRSPVSSRHSSGRRFQQ